MRFRNFHVVPEVSRNLEMPCVDEYPSVITRSTRDPRGDIQLAHAQDRPDRDS